MLSVPKTRDNIYTDIYNKNKLGLYCTAWEILMNRSDSEDVVMEALDYLLRWPRKVIGFTPQQTTAYLRRISKCRAIDRYRKNNTEVAYKNDQKENWKTVHMLKSLEDQALLDFSREAIKKAIRSLPYVYNVSIRYELADGLSSKQIGEIMDVSPSTVRKRQQRARYMIHDYLVTHYSDNKKAVSS